METKSKVFKRKTGKSKNKWIVRIEYFDEIKGKKCFMERHADKKGDATDLRNKLLDDVKKSHGQIQTGERMTFSQLADICEETFYKPAVIVEGRKVAGVRSIQTIKYQLATLKQFFGKRLIKEITTESLFDYKLWRLKTDSKQLGRPVKISTVNRELTTMGKLMRFAYGKGWTVKDIFFNAKVIDSSSEIERTRILTLDEEKCLLNSCSGEREITYKRKLKDVEKEVTATISVDNPHLKAMIILALDSGMRRGEIFKLRWQDIDFENGIIRILGTHTKTERERLAPLSDRARIELDKLKEISSGENPFPTKDIKHSFETAKRLAKINDLHFHDLRRTAITRWIQQGTPLALAGKLGGHTQLQTTMKHYTANDADAVKEITERMNNFHSQLNEVKEVESGMLN
ncbi:MAG TPA: site-specific integrase [Pyrinomonadaceae bacterium]|nr:site-specific integrase [Pyrinomonadaceae bacterium]